MTTSNTSGDGETQEREIWGVKLPLVTSPDKEPEPTFEYRNHYANAETCEGCGSITQGHSGEPKWCCYCGAKLKGKPIEWSPEIGQRVLDNIKLLKLVMNEAYSVYRRRRYAVATRMMGFPVAGVEFCNNQITINSESGSWYCYRQNEDGTALLHVSLGYLEAKNHLSPAEVALLMTTVRLPE